jgi:hypothetical protein
MKILNYPTALAAVDNIHTSDFTVLGLANYRGTVVKL